MKARNARWILPLWLLLAPPTQAALIEVDLFAAGDGLLTRDTETDLDWLDLTQTAGLSINQVLANVGGWVGLGFSYASTDQLFTLYENAGIPDINAGYTAANVVPATELIALLGCTSECGVFQPFIPQQAVGVNSARTVASVGWRPIEGVAQAETAEGGALYPLDQQVADIGHFLIRPVGVPEPGPLALLTVGGAVLLGTLRRTRQRTG